MKKKLLLCIVIFHSLVSSSQVITVDNTLYTVPQLVQDVLFDFPAGTASSCIGTISNITWSTGSGASNGSSFNSTNGIGYFQNTNPNFPLASGVILSTGDALNAPGPNTSTLVDGNYNWPGDSDLFNYIHTLGIDPDLINYFNATVLEFNFRPLTTTMSFDFLFASEEYGYYQCEYSDAFAFFLTDLTAGSATTNLALVPGTSSPISVITICDEAYYTGFEPNCGSTNPSYFGNYNDEIASPTSATNFSGETVLMTASSTVIPNNLYHIKLVIADRNDAILDSAVFLGAGSFNIGSTPTFSTIAPICSGEVLEALPTTSNNLVTGTWSPALNNTVTTTYTFTPTAGQCASNGQLTITVLPNSISPTFASYPSSITACQAGASTQVILPTTSDNGIAGIWSPSTLDYSIVGTTVYTFTPNGGQCGLNSTTISLVINQNMVPTFTPITICAGGIASLPTNSLENFAGTWLPSSVDNTQTTTYNFTPNVGQCTSTGNLTIAVNPIITPTFNGIATLCTGETAPVLPLSSIEGISGSWTPAVIDNTVSGTYTFVPNVGECATNGSISVAVQSAFDLELSGSCVGDDFIVDVKAVTNTIDINTASFVWTNSNNQTVGNDSSSFNVTEYLNLTTEIEEVPITFTVTVTNSEGCNKTESITLPRIFCGIQKGISLNDDGLNDYFDLTLLDIKSLSIFNRYGMKVYSKNGYTNEWVGQSDKGDKLPDGTYYYVIDFNDNLTSKAGWIYVNTKN